MKLSRRHFLTASAAALLPHGPIRAAAGGPNLIWVFAEGGWDTTHALDPKIGIGDIVGPEINATGAPGDLDEIVNFGALPIAVNARRRPAVGDFFAAYAHRCLLVNGAWCGAVGHPLARHRLLSGTHDIVSPDITVRFGVGAGADHPVAAYSLSRWTRPGPHAPALARTGATDQLHTLVGPAVGGWNPSEDAEIAMLAHTSGRAARMEDRWGTAGATRLGGFTEAGDRALDLRTIAFDAQLDLSATDDLVRGSGQAIALLRNGITRSILLSQGGFDTHGTSNQDGLHDALFRGVHALVAGLDAAGLLDDTLVVVSSEMTRTPVLNSMGGKDHWPYLSYLFLGGGVAGDRVLGGTDDRMEGAAVDVATGERHDAGELLRYDHVLAGVLAHLDVDPDPHWPGVAPFRGFTA